VLTGNDDGQRLDRFLRKKFPQIPLSAVYKILRQEKVKIARNEKKFHGKKETMLQKGDEMTFYFSAADFGEAPEPKKTDFSFVTNSRFFKDHFRTCYEDEYFWAADKLPGIAVHPGTDTPWGKSLIDLFVAYQKQKHPNEPEPKLVHRLDKDTSGIVLISKNDAVLRKLTELIRDGDIQKHYLALVKGRVNPPSGSIEGNLIRNEGSKYTKIQLSHDKKAKFSRTFYDTVEYFPKLKASLVEVVLDTGRMHQIRVHFASLGHPLAADDVYGERDWNRYLRKEFGLKRHFLHAYFLSFIHPITKKRVKIESPLAPDLEKILPSKKLLGYTHMAQK
jgi:23S rRNA pseudouridine955/2504/2580 synthase